MSRRALNLLRPGLHRRRDAFDAGLRAAGFALTEALSDPRAGDVLLIWNRYGGFNDQAEIFEAAGATVLVAENCPFGNEFQGGSYSLARRHVALTGGEIVVAGGPERWDAWSVDLRPWRDTGGDIVVLEQRGIGHPTVRSPPGWADRARGITGGRIRRHPGNGTAAVPLREDLRRASGVVTWSSAAAVQALALGVPVWHEHPLFVARGACHPLSAWPCPPRRDDEARLLAMRRLAWGIWTIPEIESGEPLVRLTAH